MSEERQAAQETIETSKEGDDRSKNSSREPTTFLDSNWTWSDFSSWPLTVKFFPILIGVAAVLLAVIYQHLYGDKCISGFNYGFNIDKARDHATRLATHDWEIGTAAEGLLELLHPEYSVFGPDPFPREKVPKEWVMMNQASVYVHRQVRLSSGPTLWEDSLSVSDPAALGVFALMIGRHKAGWMQAATKQKNFLLKDAPRYDNGATSHRIESPEVWSDAVFMVPPFLAYYAVATKELEVMKDAVKQIQLHRDVLLIREGDRKGLWKHIVGDSARADDGAWSTGNAWAAYGMLRVRATITAWKQTNATMKTEVKLLDNYILEILTAAIRTDNDKSSLLRNYLGDQDWYGETSGTTLLAAAAYRMGMFMEPGSSRDRILTWADQKRRTIVQSVNANGIVKPAVNPLKHDQREPIDNGSPEGESFLLLMSAAWRDCVCAGICTLET